MKKYFITTVFALLLSIAGISNAMARCDGCTFAAGAATASAVIMAAQMSRSAYSAPAYYQQPSYYQPQAYYQPQPQPVYTPPVQTVYVQQPSPQPQSNWYYCQSSSRYYPYTKHCPEGWMEVVPRRP